eukprot:620582-Amphidinium_carterae.1
MKKKQGYFGPMGHEYFYCIECWLKYDHDGEQAVVEANSGVCLALAFSKLHLAEVVKDALRPRLHSMWMRPHPIAHLVLLLLSIANQEPNTTGQMSLLRTSSTRMLATMTLQFQDLTPAKCKTKARGKPTLSAVQVSL